jgi:tRNA pseudouridine55 synthase
MYSALKQNGQRLYTLARSGQTVEREPRRVVLSRLVLLDSLGENTYCLHVVCSKGTYIRTLCHDIGRSLGCGAVMTGLRRTRVGQFTESRALSIESIAEAAESGAAQSLLLPIDTCFMQYPAMEAVGEQERRCRNGNPFPAKGEPGLYRVYDGQNSFLMLGRLRPDGCMETVKSFY